MNEVQRSDTGYKKIISILALFVYPFVLIASLMSLSGFVGSNEPFLLILVAKAFLYCSLAYPLVCILSFFDRVTKKGEAKENYNYSFTFNYLLLCAGLFVLWGVLGYTFEFLG